MKTYLLSIHTPAGPPPPDLDLTGIMEQIEVVNAEIRAAGSFVFAGGLGDLGSATVAAPDAAGEVLLTDGPFLEVREHLGGLSIVRSDDYDRVLHWAKRLSAIVMSPIEVRPFVDDDDRGQAPTSS